jgi:hypothetical protein
MKRMVFAALLVVAAACGAATPLPGSLPGSATALVRTLGDGPQPLGTLVARDDARGLLEVAFHDGRRVWVASADVAPAALAPGVYVATRWSEAPTLWTGEVVAVNGALVEVRYTDGSVHLVSAASIVAVSDTAIAPATTATDPGGGREPEQATPPIELARRVIAERLDVYVPGHAVRCDDGVVVLLSNGETARVPEADVRTADVLEGSRVAVRYQGGALSYMATPSSLENGRIDVRYDDGSEESGVSLDLVTYVLHAPEAARPSRADAPLCRRLRGAEAPVVFVRRGSAERVATLAECVEGGRADVTSADGSTQRVELASLRRLSVQSGDTIYLPWGGASSYFATVVSRTGDQMLIRYEDGSEEERPVTDVQIRFVPGGAAASSEPPACNE